MPDITLTDLLAMPEPEQDVTLRRLCTEVLEPGPWKHCWHYNVSADWWTCVRCGLNGVMRDQNGCSVPPEASGSWADLADRLRERTGRSPRWIGALGKAVLDFNNTDRPGFSVWLWLSVEATARERVICLLIALGKLLP